MLYEIAPVAPYAIALLAFALAGTVIAAAFIELPPPARMPRPAIVVAGSWFAAFLAAVVLRHPFRDFLVTALLIAAAVIWLSRGHEQRDDGHRHPPPDPPPPTTMPDEYWQRWEDQFHPEHSHPLRRLVPTARLLRSPRTAPFRAIATVWPRSPRALQARSSSRPSDF